MKFLFAGQEEGQSKRKGGLERDPYHILALITIHSSIISVIFSTPLLQFTKGLCFL